jgi:hypothetical protein
MSQPKHLKTAEVHNSSPDKLDKNPRNNKLKIFAGLALTNWVKIHVITNLKSLQEIWQPQDCLLRL